MNNIIDKIIRHENIEDIFQWILRRLYINGPVSITDMEILSYLYIYTQDEFKKYNNEILKFMGVNYKNIPVENLYDVIFGMYNKFIQDKYSHTYTPVQANIVKNIQKYRCFSFSAPTSTGKSFVFRNIIMSSEQDIVIIVPSRALINEYYYKICELIPDKNVNILTFIDKINTKHAKRNVFIVTPERCKELFKYKEDFNIEYFMFDEAQLSDEESIRGLYFDSIIRRIQKSFPITKFIFAHPFVKNPEAQIIKNHFDMGHSKAYQYIQKNVGQMFYVYEHGAFYHFGIKKEIMGERKVKCNFDPVKTCIENKGSVLIYTTKASIYSGKVFQDFERYIKMCVEITDIRAKEYIKQIKSYIGATDNDSEDRFSQMVYLLKRGIVVHHGSLPLQARMLIEQFTQKGFCKLCFATSTLEQGINMPFDVVFLNTFQASKPLALKNLIGRAGRSTTNTKFDYGCIIIHRSNMSKFRKIMTTDDELGNVSLLDVDDITEDYKEFKEAILAGNLSDEYNLTNTQLEKLSCNDANIITQQILNQLFNSLNQIISLDSINKDLQCKLQVYNDFQMLYEVYLGRELEEGEKSVFDTAIKIMMWKIHCKTFKDICFYRYAYASQMQERRKLESEINKAHGSVKSLKENQLNNLYAAFVQGYHDIPDKSCKRYSMFGNHEVKAKNVNYDRIVFDTYDYLDKIIGFKLSDIFYATLKLYYEQTQDIRADKLSKYIKYGTEVEREIWMLRYGLTFEDIEWADECIDSIGEEEIIFNSLVNNLDENKRNIIKRFI